MRVKIRVNFVHVLSDVINIIDTIRAGRQHPGNARSLGELGTAPVSASDVGRRYDREFLHTPDHRPGKVRALGCARFGQVNKMADCLFYNW